MHNEFDKYAASYDRALRESLPAGMEEDQYFARYKVDFLRAATHAKTVGSILDFGCGAGRSLQYLAESFPHASIHGFDPSPESIRIAAQRVPRAKLTAQWQETSTQRFDVVFAANVFHHVARAELPAWLRNCRDVLAADGRLFVFEHNPLNPVTRRVFERCPFDIDAHMILRNELLALGDGAGLRPVARHYTLFFPKPLKWLRPLERWLGWLPLGAQYCVEFAAQ